MYVLCILKTGPKDAEVKGDERKAIFAGHFENIGRLANEGKLAVAISTSSTNSLLVRVHVLRGPSVAPRRRSANWRTPRRTSATSSSFNNASGVVIALSNVCSARTSAATCFSTRSRMRFSERSSSRSNACASSVARATPSREGFLRDTRRGRVYKLAGTLEIGRDSKCDVLLTEPEVSRVHAELYAREDGFWVCPVGNAYTLVNHNRLMEPVQLAEGDEILIQRSVPCPTCNKPVALVLAVYALQKRLTRRAEAALA